MENRLSSAPPSRPGCTRCLRAAGTRSSCSSRKLHLKGQATTHRTFCRSRTRVRLSCSTLGRKPRETSWSETSTPASQRNCSKERTRSSPRPGTSSIRPTSTRATSGPYRFHSRLSTSAGRPLVSEAGLEPGARSGPVFRNRQSRNDPEAVYRRPTSRLCHGRDRRQRDLRSPLPRRRGQVASLQRRRQATGVEPGRERAVLRRGRPLAGGGGLNLGRFYSWNAKAVVRGSPFAGVPRHATVCRLE